MSTRLRRRLLREPGLTLENMAIGRSFEASERQALQIEADILKTTDLEVNAINSRDKVTSLSFSSAHYCMNGTFQYYLLLLWQRWSPS